MKTLGYYEANEIFVTEEMENRRCPLNARRCLASDCALWNDVGFRLIYGRGYGGRVFSMGFCTLSRRR